MFPNAPEPFLDLSTAISPHPYPISGLSDDNFSLLPEPSHLEQLVRHAAAAYGTSSTDHVVAAPGSQILMTLIADHVPKGRAAILGPTYAEHAHVAALAGHAVETVTAPSRIGEAALAVVVNPNNPDGRALSKEDLLEIADRQRAHGGLLVVDEAFMDVGSRGESLSADVEQANIVVLRSFGKFFGLAGLRLSFAVAPKDLATRLRARLGPWPVSGPALAIGASALSDEVWIAKMRATLKSAALRLGGLLQEAGLVSVGRTDLFNLVSSAEAQELFARLGRAGVFVRRFEENPHWLRFGLPGPEEAWARLENALRDEARK